MIRQLGTPLSRSLFSHKFFNLRTTFLKSSTRQLSTPIENTKEDAPILFLPSAATPEEGLGLKTKIIGGILFAAGILVTADYFFNETYRTCGGFKTSMRLLEDCDEITNVTGLPIKPSYRINGYRYGGHNLYLSWKVYGPTGKAQVVCRTSFFNKKGTIIELYATPEGHEKVTLIDLQPEPLFLRDQELGLIAKENK